MSDRNALRRPIMRLVTAVMDDRVPGDPTMGQIADDLLAEIEPLIRADERERIAQAIEAMRDRERENRDRFDNDPLRDRESYRVAVRIHAERAQSYDEAARIARNGGAPK